MKSQQVMVFCLLKSLIKRTNNFQPRSNWEKGAGSPQEPQKVIHKEVIKTSLGLGWLIG